MNNNEIYQKALCKIEKYGALYPSCCCCYGPTGATGVTGPTGPTGASGEADTITIRNTTTGDPGTSAQVTDATGGPNHILDFIIPRGFDGKDGEIGPTGPTGPAGTCEKSTNCSCVDQMRNIIQQIITLYPNENLNVALESGNNVTGRPGTLLPTPNSNPNSGLFQLVNSQGVLQEAVSLCKIVSINITSSTYNNLITYLPAPTPLPSGCDSNCEAAIRSYLPVGTPSVLIKAGGQTVAQGTVLKSEYGMIVIVENNNTNPTFVSLCKTEIVKKGVKDEE